MTRLMSLMALALAAFGATAADPPAGPAKDVPELEVLKHWIGTWDDEMTIKSSDGPPQGIRAKGVVTAEWTLGGRFVRQTAATEGGGGGVPGMSVLTLMTYDPQKKVYRTWMFFSTGTVSEFEGRWDEKRRTMTSTSRESESGGTATITATFAADGAETWRLVEKDRDGKVIAETTGKNTPRKK